MSNIFQVATKQSITEHVDYNHVHSNVNEKELRQLSLQNRLSLFSLSIPQPPLTDLSLSLERLAHVTGGESFFVADQERPGDKSSLSAYVSLVDAFREIQHRTLPSPSSLVSDSPLPPLAPPLTSFNLRERQITRCLFWTYFTPRVGQSSTLTSHNSESIRPLHFKWDKTCSQGQIL